MAGDRSRVMVSRWTDKGAWARGGRWRALRAEPAATVARVWEWEWGGWGADKLHGMREAEMEGEMVYPLGGGALAGAELVRGAVEVQALAAGVGAGGKEGARTVRLRPCAMARGRSGGDAKVGRGAVAGAFRTMAGMCLTVTLAVTPRRGGSASTRHRRAVKARR